MIRRTWFWIAVGVMGQGLFGCRFLVQWLVTEYKRRSVMPVAFWWLSLAASLLLLSSYLHRLEWILAFGVGVTIPIYIRNLILIRRSRIVPDPEDTAVAEGLNSGEITKT